VSVRAEKVAVILELRAQGLLLREVAERLGLPFSTVTNYANDPDGAKARARKASYRGTCRTCGKRTDGSNGRAKAPDYCAHHMWDDPDFRAAQTDWPKERVIAKIREWADLHGEPPARTDWNPTAALAMGDPERAARFRAGDWPWFMVVVRMFGSWNAGITAAGFTPRAPHGDAANAVRRRDRRKVAA